MKVRPGILVSSAAHAALLLYGLLNLGAAKPFEASQMEALPIEILSPEEFAAMQGDKNSKKVDTPKQKAEKVAEDLRDAHDVIAGIEDDDLPADATVAFDLGDAIWMRGYCNVLMSLADFLLSYDWHEGFEASFQEFFPHAGLPFAAELIGGRSGFEPRSPRTPMAR